MFQGSWLYYDDHNIQNHHQNLQENCKLQLYVAIINIKSIITMIIMTVITMITIIIITIITTSSLMAKCLSATGTTAILLTPVTANII